MCLKHLLIASIEMFYILSEQLLTSRLLFNLNLLSELNKLEAFSTYENFRQKSRLTQEHCEIVILYNI